MAGALGGFSVFDYPPPIFLFSLFLWYFRLDFAPRMLWGITAGLFLDSWSLLPFGSYLIILTLAGFLADFLKEISGDLDSFFLRALAAAALLWLSLTILSPLGQALSLVVSDSGVVRFLRPESFLMPVFWAAVLGIMAGVLRGLRLVS